MTGRPVTNGQGRLKNKARREAALVGKKDQPVIPLERWQHNRIRDHQTIRAGETGLMVLDQTWLDRYHDRGQIADRQRDAGQKLFHDWFASGLQKAVTGAYEGGGGAGQGRKHGKRPTDAVPRHEPLQAYFKALRQLSLQQRQVIRSVAIEDIPAGQACVKHGVPVYSYSIQYLREALDALADVYGLPADRVGA